jgi:uncharacterized membrane protein YfcA
VNLQPEDAGFRPQSEARIGGSPPKHGLVDVPLAVRLAGFSVVGAVVGAITLLSFPAESLQQLLGAGFAVQLGNRRIRWLYIAVVGVAALGLIFR